MSDWHGLYREGWQGEIVPEAFAHPAKFARGLIRHIYQHLLDEGLVRPGDAVVDCFGGVGLGALDAMRQGLHWVGVELEPRFVDLGQQNIDLWNARYRPHFPTWGAARLVQGDSRELARVLGAAGGAVTSPPYANAQAHPSIGSVSKDDWGNNGHDIVARRGLSAEYGQLPHNLGNLPPGDLGAALGAALTSPPYMEQVIRDRDPGKPGFTQGTTQGQHAFDAYGHTPGQLGAMREGAAASVTSPPFEKSIGLDGGAAKRPNDYGHIGSFGKEYGDADGNLGNDTGDTFWTAARTIVAQLYQVLRPGAPAVFVVKAFVRKGERVDFPGQWRQLCEACGFVLLHEHRAWLVEDRGAQWGLFGDLHERTVERKSFFRRLAERNGAPRIDWEMVLCMRKPA